MVVIGWTVVSSSQQASPGERLNTEKHGSGGKGACGSIFCAFGANFM